MPEVGPLLTWGTPQARGAGVHSNTVWALGELSRRLVGDGSQDDFDGVEEELTDAKEVGVRAI